VKVGDLVTVIDKNQDEWTHHNPWMERILPRFIVTEDMCTTDPLLTTKVFFKIRCMSTGKAKYRIATDLRLFSSGAK